MGQVPPIRTRPRGAQWAGWSLLATGAERREKMLGSRRLAVVLLVAVVAGACSSGSGTTAPLTTAPPTLAPLITPPPTAAPSTGGGPTAAASTSAGGGGALGGTVVRGGDMCGLLGPGDFAAVGVTGAGTPTRNSDAPTDAYCVYAGISSATGGIEFDVFLGDPVGTYQEVKANGGILLDDATGDLPGVDAAGTQLKGPGGMATIGVKTGQLTFDIGFPTNPNARTQLIALAKLVLQRGSGLT
jgi:hypothetical protein